MVLRTLRTKMTAFLWFALIIFVGAFVIGSILRRFSTRKLTPQEEGLVGTVDKRPLTYSDYTTLIEQYKKQGLNQSSASQSAFNSLIEEALINRAIEHRGLNLSNTEVIEFIKNNPPPAFLEDTLLQTDGKFDLYKYQTIIFDPQNARWLNSYAEFISSNIPRQIFYQIIVGTVRPTTMEVVEELLQQRAKLKVEYAMISPTEFKKETDELKKYYSAHLDEFVVSMPMINYVSFPVKLTMEDEMWTQETAKEIADLLKQGANPETLKVQYGCKWVGASPRSHITSAQEKNITKKDNGFYIPVRRVGATPPERSSRSHLFLPILPSYETISAVEGKAEDFIESAKIDFETAATEYGLKVYKCLSDELEAIELSYLNLDKAGKIIGPIQADTCIYVIQTLGMQKPEFSEIENRVREGYFKEYVKELYNRIKARLLRRRRIGQAEDFRKLLSESPYAGKIKSTKLSGIDESPEGNEFFIQALNIMEDSVGLVYADDIFYLVHCLERVEPSHDSLEKELPQFYSVWMSKESERIYQDWLNNLKQSAVIKDYRYKIR